MEITYFYTFPKVSKCFNTSVDTPPNNPGQWSAILWNGDLHIPCFWSIFNSNISLKSTFYGISIWPQKKINFSNTESWTPPPSVVFLNCCAMFFCNGLKDFKLKYGHHEYVVSLLSNYKFNETSFLINFAKKYHLIWDQYNFFKKSLQNTSQTL